MSNKSQDEVCDTKSNDMEEISLRPGSSFFSSGLSSKNVDNSQARKRHSSRDEQVTQKFLHTQRLNEKTTKYKPMNYSGDYQSSYKKRFNNEFIFSRSGSNLSDSEREECELLSRNHCNKHFKLKARYEKLPHPPVEKLLTCAPLKVPEFQSLKDKLNSIKGEAERGDDLSAWTNHTFTVNPAAPILPKIKHQAKPEFISQAFLKFYEVLCAFPLIPDDMPHMSSLHLCEAPGAFVVALNHYLVQHKPNVKWDWLANTLNPHYEGCKSSQCISDDRIILKSLPHWVFGEDGTGDITLKSCLQEIKKRCNNLPSPVYLVTADGSIDCQSNPGEQEEMTSHLHFCEVINALEILCKGGNFVIKTFTFFESSTHNLLYFLSLSFEEINVYKPITSKLGNSEVYVVCTGYQGRSSIEKYLEKLVDAYGPEPLTNAIFNEIPPDFKNKVKQCAEYFMKHQVEAIERNVTLYHDKSESNETCCSYVKELVLKNFRENNPIDPIDSDLFVTDGCIEWDQHIHPKHRNNNKWIGHFLKMDINKKAQYLIQQLDEITSLYIDKGRTTPKILKFKPITNVINKMKLSLGVPFLTVNTTRFCYERIIHLYSAYIELVQLLKQPVTITNPILIDNVIHIITDKGSKTPEIDFEGDLNDLNLATRNLVSKIQNQYHNCHIFILPFPDHNEAPTSSCKVLEHIFNLIKSNKITANDTVCIVNQPLLSRQQNGLFCALSSCFSDTTLESSYSASIFNRLLTLPVFVLKDLDITCSKNVIDKLNEIGWVSGDKRAMEVLDALTLIKSGTHSVVCLYNAQLLLSWCCMIAETL